MSAGLISGRLITWRKCPQRDILLDIERIVGRVRVELTTPGFSGTQDTLDRST
jgi:hypothetical protein